MLRLGKLQRRVTLGQAYESFCSHRSKFGSGRLPNAASSALDQAGVAFFGFPLGQARGDRLRHRAGDCCRQGARRCTSSRERRCGLPKDIRRQVYPAGAAADDSRHDF